jgi:hypothetical protein
MTDLANALARAWAPVVQQFAEAARQLLTQVGENMRRFWDTPDGRYLKAVVECFQQHPELLDAMIAAREAEARVPDCHCLCQRWDHLGICASYSTTQRTFRSAELGDTVVPMCGPCAADLDGKRTMAQI